jgi:hypothetical protein
MGIDTSRREQIAKNEALYRAVNERLVEISAATTPAPDDDRFFILCECGNRACAEQIRIRAAAYERVRADPTLFVVVPGHTIEEVERLVGKTDAYEIVCKDTEPGRTVAQASDPRR